MKRRVITLIAAAATIALAGAAVAAAHPDSGYGDGHRADRGKPSSGQRTVTLRAAKSAKTAYLTGRAEIGKDGRRGAGDLDATGTAVFQLVDQRTICYGFTVDNTDTPQIVHIHRGAADENGPPVIAFANVPKGADGQPNGDPGTSSGCKTVSTPEELAALKRIRKNPRNYYVNLHTLAYPDGAVRGQLSHLLFSNR